MSENLRFWTVIGVLGVSLLTASAGSFAHHSRSNFMFDTVIEMEGIITSFEYRNPHTFLTIETMTEAGEAQEWLLAANSISSLKSAGWNANSFAVGERVTATGNPDRNPNKHLMYLDVITKTDGSVYASGKIAPGGRVAERVDGETGSTNFSGVWQPPFNPRNMAANFQAADLPLTEKGQSSVDAYDQAEDPALNCEADAAPMTILPIYPMQITRVGDDEVHFWYQQFDGRRVVHLDMDTHPENTVPSHMGHSIGQIEGDTLTVDTAYFAEDQWGLGRGAPSGLQKHVVERYTLVDNGMNIAVEYTFEDPEYMTESVTGSGVMAFRPEYQMEPWDCDPQAARRHLTVE